jgi:hypothetical protein
MSSGGGDDGRGERCVNGDVVRGGGTCVVVVVVVVVDCDCFDKVDVVGGDDGRF